ncbi:MAG: 16S rRNA (guanine(966)-N(2))-methyltransferase RsmD [Pelagibacteraceae bacterium TMED216]|nr:MAG: 16S rRNA (guanine(966)-N(2))-methyltransferase RsmD [Pelagibacteraceae bacterium TMED216]|tara:strand:+ start:4329 stop:4895 length:567 start_codon:yes stop_codon:yes gene_type:complete
MRICGGNLKGKKLIFSSDKITRPLKEIVKQSIFNTILNSNKFNVNLIQSNILDLFSGTGSFGIECLSHGANHVTFVEKNMKIFNILRKNLTQLHLSKKSKVVNEDIEKAFKKNLILNSYDIVFFDPPFANDQYKIIFKFFQKNRILNNNNLVIIHRENKTNENLGDFVKIYSERIFGRSKILYCTLLF